MNLIMSLIQQSDKEEIKMADMGATQTIDPGLQNTSSERTKRKNKNGIVYTTHRNYTTERAHELKAAASRNSLMKNRSEETENGRAAQ